MTILVDPILFYPNVKLKSKKWCHMGTDDLTPQGLIELNAMAARLNLLMHWFQDRAFLPHYDLTPAKRMLAIQYGAVEVTSQEWIMRCKRVERFVHKNA